MIHVTCAIIRNEENEVLVVQRGEKTDHPFKWEFPGGKLKEGETEEECTIREIKEELAIDIVICSRMPDTVYDYGHKQIILIPFVCDTLDELPLLSEHIAYRWLNRADLKDVDFSGADIVVAENYLKSTKTFQNQNETIPETGRHASNEEDLRSMVSNIRGTKEADWLATYAIDNYAIINKIIEYSFSNDEKLAFHASWVLSKMCDTCPEIIYPYLPRIIEAFDSLDNESVCRSFLRSISLSDMQMVSNKHHGILADHCFKMLRSGFSAIAIKAYSMEIIYKLAQIYPELTNELSETIGMLQGEGSAGIVARGCIVLKKLGNYSRARGSSLT
jgi:8-oxo-dGTP diphosphatase